MNLPKLFKAWISLSFLGLAACSFDQGGLALNTDGGANPADAQLQAPDSAVSPDADLEAADAAPGGPDAMPASPDARTCAGDNLIVTASNISDDCDVPDPTGSFTLTDGDWVLDTDNRTIHRTDDIFGSPQPLSVAWTTIAQTSGPEILVIAVDDMIMTNGILATTELDVVGSRALMIVSFGTVSIDGELRVGARGTSSGPGADHATACTDGFGSAGVIQNALGGSGGSGGGGGGYGGAGGGGAKVDDDGGALPTVAVSGGAIHGTTSIVPLRGGCRGGVGANNGGGGGGGGGALQITANGAITIDGYVSAHGAGGRGVEAANTGGGGGGSGGALLFESAVSITINGAITANGGGGGEGTRGGGIIWNGENGEDGSHDSGDQAGGASSDSLGGDGGSGGSLAGDASDGTVGQSDGSNLGGGGGGGGGGGRIHLSSPATSTPGSVSPAPQ